MKLGMFFTAVMMTLPLGMAHAETPAQDNAGHDAAKNPPVYAQPTAEDKALAARAHALSSADMENAGREAANFVNYEWPKNFIPMLSGERPATSKELSDARNVVQGLVETAEQGPNWPKASWRIPYTATAPTIDGKLDEPAWAQAAVQRGVYPFGRTDRLDSPASTWRVMWNHEFLFVGFECKDADVIAPVLQRDDRVYEHDCVELFILPEFRSGVYWEIVIGPSGSIFDALHAKKFKGWGAVSRVDQNVKGMKVGTWVDGSANVPGDRDRGYCIEFAVPFRELPSYTRGNRPKGGDIIYFMLVRLDETEGQPLATYAFQPLLSWGHNIWNHARVELVE